MDRVFAYGGSFAMRYSRQPDIQQANVLDWQSEPPQVNRRDFGLAPA
jgi:hypothetical protein